MSDVDNLYSNTFTIKLNPKRCLLRGHLNLYTGTMFNAGLMISGL